MPAADPESPAVDLSSPPGSLVGRARHARAAFAARRAACLSSAGVVVWELELRAQLSRLTTRIDPHPFGVRAAVAATADLAVLEDLAKALWVADACAVLPLLHIHAVDLVSRPA